MRYLLRVFLFNSFSLWLVSQILPALTVTGGWQGLLFSGLVLSILMILVAPILKILFLPINILTFGLLSWLINVCVLYLLTIFVSGVSIHAWVFPGISWQGFSVPSIPLSYPIALILASLAVTFFSNLFHDISEQ